MKISQNTTSPKELKQKLQQNGIVCYERNGKLTGIWNEKGTRKYRLKNLGVDIHEQDRVLSIENEKQIKRNQQIRGRDME